MFQIVWRVYSDITAEEVANFPQPANDPVVEIPPSADRAFAFELYGKTVTEMAAIEFARSLNAEEGTPTFRHPYLVARGILNRDHRLPAFRNVVI